MLELNKIYNMDCIEGMKQLDKNSIDTIITDPPYGLEFMGVAWDIMNKGKPRTRNEWKDFGSREHARTSGEQAKVQRNKSIALYDFSLKWVNEAIRVTKPGGTLLCFGGTRTHHRVACAIEDTGWILKDCIMWLYGSGFPKAADISKKLDKRGGKLIGKGVADLIKKKRLELGYSTIKLAELGKFYGDVNHGGTVSNWETGKGEITLKQFNRLIDILGLGNDPIVEAEREVIGKQTKARATGQKIPMPTVGVETEYIEIDITLPSTPEAKQWDGWKSHGLKPAYEPILVAMKPNDGSYANNALKWGVSGINIDACRIPTNEKLSIGSNKRSDAVVNFGMKDNKDVQVQNPKGRYPSNVILDEVSAKLLDEQTGILKSGTLTGSEPSKPTTNCYGKFKNRSLKTVGDKGGASRFFYCAKASKGERNKGCENLPTKKIPYSDYRKNYDTTKSYVSEYPDGKPRPMNKMTNFHPTVKPLKLMEYLCTLTKTPTGGIVLDPFLGSGTTAIACKKLRRNFIGFEISKEYYDIANARLKATLVPRSLFD